MDNFVEKNCNKMQ